jgi:hypothetical protein
MDYPTVTARLNDLPSPFKRNGPPYTWLIDSIGWQLAMFTLAADATSQQVLAFGPALDGWLDVWGLLWGVPRQQQEANSSYSLRIARTVLAWVGTLPAIQAWVNFYAPGGSVTENLPNVGYVITFPSNMTTAQITAFLLSLNRIRPAGVPFIVVQATGGITLGTDIFLATGAPKGAYLSAAVTTLALPIGPATNNTSPLLPTCVFSDPTLNPSLAV